MAEKEYIERGAALAVIAYNPLEKPAEPDIVELTLLTAQKQIRKIPAADVVEVCRCKNCVYWEDSEKLNKPICCNIYGLGAPDADDFCSCGERKENNG